MCTQMRVGGWLCMCTQRKGSCVLVHMGVFARVCAKAEGGHICRHRLLCTRRRKRGRVCAHMSYVVIEEKGSVGYAHEHIRVGVCMYMHKERRPHKSVQMHGRDMVCAHAAWCPVYLDLSCPSFALSLYTNTWPLPRF